MVTVKKAQSPGEKEAAYHLRIEVFVHEQYVPLSEEIDEFEEDSHHFIAEDENGTVVGAARWRKTNKGVKLERFVVKKSARGHGIGSLLVKAVLDNIDQNTAIADLEKYLHAQVEAVFLYEKFGFIKVGPPFDECGILHHLMKKSV